MLDDPMIITLGAGVGFYVMVWLTIPSQHKKCEQCDCRLKRIPRLRWQRALSLFIPLVNMRCEYCAKTTTRRRRIFSK